MIIVKKVDPVTGKELMNMLNKTNLSSDEMDTIFLDEDMIYCVS